MKSVAYRRIYRSYSGASAFEFNELPFPNEIY